MRERISGFHFCDGFDGLLFVLEGRNDFDLIKGIIEGVNGLKTDEFLVEKVKHKVLEETISFWRREKIRQTDADQTDAKTIIRWIRRGIFRRTDQPKENIEKEIIIDEVIVKERANEFDLHDSLLMMRGGIFLH